MNYFFKKIGSKKRSQGFVISEVEKNDCRFWEEQCRIYFGTNSKPAYGNINKGDILIQEVSSIKPSQHHTIIGIYECLSEMREEAIGPYTCEEEKGKWKFYIEAKCLTLKYSLEAKKETGEKLSYAFESR